MLDPSRVHYHKGLEEKVSRLAQDHLVHEAFSPTWNIPQTKMQFYFHKVLSCACTFAALVLIALEWVFKCLLLTYPLGQWLSEQRIERRAYNLSSKHEAIANLFLLKQKHIPREELAKSICRAFESIEENASMHISQDVLDSLWHRLEEKGEMSRVVKFLGESHRLARKAKRQRLDQSLEQLFLKRKSTGIEPVPNFRHLSIKEHRSLAQMAYDNLQTRLEMAFFLLKLRYSDVIKGQVENFGSWIPFVQLEKFDLREDQEERLSQYDILDIKCEKTLWFSKNRCCKITVEQAYHLSVQELSERFKAFFVLD